MEIRLAAPIQRNSIVDGEGIRAVIWTQGCIHHCPGCHNQETWDFNGGALIDVEDLKKDIDTLSEEVGITFSGGDPFCQVEACLEVAKYAKSIGLNVWCYTGYTYERIIRLALDDEKVMAFLENIDVLVDGPFILKERSFDVKFRGSKNQRIIDVAKSLKENRVVEIPKYQYRENIIPEVLTNRQIYI